MKQFSEKPNYAAPSVSDYRMELEGFLCASTLMFGMYVDEYDNMGEEEFVIID